MTVKPEKDTKGRMLAVAALLAAGFLVCTIGLVRVQLSGERPAVSASAKPNDRSVVGRRLTPVSTSTRSAKKPDLLKRVWRKFKRFMNTRSV